MLNTLFIVTRAVGVVLRAINVSLFKRLVRRLQLRGGHIFWESLVKRACGLVFHSLCGS